MLSDREQRIKTGRPLQCLKMGVTLLLLEFDSVKNPVVVLQRMKVGIWALFGTVRLIFSQSGRMF